MCVEGRGGECGGGGGGVSGCIDVVCVSGGWVWMWVCGCCVPSSILSRLKCWETFVGQELYKLSLINFVLSAITTLSVETARK